MSTQIPALNSISLGAIAGAGQSAMGMSDDIMHHSRGLSIRIVPANGGTIISMRNENDFSSVSDLYVISQDQDVGAEIGKIITMHYLKK